MSQPINKTLEKAGTLIVAKMRDALKQQKANASGRLSDSISYTVNDTAEGSSLLIGMEDYGPIIDGGRGSSKSSGGVDWKPKIIQWMRAKGIRPKAGVSMETAAYLIYRKINQKGYKPKPFIQVSLDYVVDQVLPKELEEAMVQVVEETLRRK